MKRKKFYTFIVAESQSSSSKAITVEKKYIHIFLCIVCGLFLLLTAFLTDYFGLYVDQWKLSQLKKENKQLKQKFVYVEQQFKDLEKKVSKISDFSRKLQLITNASPEQISKQMGFGKLHSHSSIVDLSTSNPLSRNPGSLSKEKMPSFDKQKEFSFPVAEPTHYGSWQVRIEKLKGKSELVKQSAWDLYTDLLEKQELLNSTPSISPVKGWISSDFGYRNETIYSDHEPYFHRGVDIASMEGRPVVSTADGKVVSVGYDRHGYGYLIVIDHGYGLQTYYAHLKEIKTKKGKYIQKGEAIATVGSTGRSTGPHLHYEVRIFGVPVNPKNYILDQADLLFAQK